jgi:nucleoside-diphosphate-sugar epimerase
MRYLIAGAQGFLGRHLAARILEEERDAEIVGIGRSAAADRFFTHAAGARRAPLPPKLLVTLDGRYRYRQLPLCDSASLRQLICEFRPHRVFHLASALHTAPERDLIETNIEGTASLMGALEGSDALLIVGSSASVYGEPAAVPIAEFAPCNPIDLYGTTKLAAEHIARIKAMQMGLGWITARIFNVVGPGQSEAHVCGRLAAQLASRRPALEVGSLDATRDFIDVRDVAAALLLVANRGERGGTYNIASGHETPIHFILSELIRISGLTVAITSRNDLPRGVRRHVADVSRLKGLGFVPAYSLGESLRDLFRYQQTELCPCPRVQSSPNCLQDQGASAGTRGQP